MYTCTSFRKLCKTNFAIISIWTANLEKRRYKNKVERGTFYYNPGWYSIIYISASKWPPSFYRYFSTKRWKFPQTRLVFFGIHLCCYFVHTLLQIIDTIRLSLLNDMVHFPQNQNSNRGRSELHESFTKCWISFAHARIHPSPVLHSSRILEFPNDFYESCQIEVILLPINHPKLLTSLVKWSAAYLWTIHIFFALKKSYLPVFQRFSFLPFVQIQLI